MYVSQTNLFSQKAEKLGYRLKNDPEAIAKILNHYEIEFVLKETKGYFVVPCPICHREKYGDKCTLKETCVRTEQDCVDLTAQIRFVFREPNYRVNWRCFRDYNHAFKFYNSIVGYIAACLNGSSYTDIVNTIERLLDDDNMNDLGDIIVDIKQDVKQDIKLDTKQDTKQNTKQNIKKLTPTQQQIIKDANIQLTDKQIDGIAILNEVFNEENGTSELESIIKNKNVYKEAEEGHTKEGKLYANK